MIQYKNALSNERSPYLLMHAHNPVNWFPWCNEALEKAKNENKLIIISIGYAACHWCHVMEKESFSNADVAEKMNRDFVSIKIDREERPDLDQVFMDVAHLTTGRGGWPLNIIALPDGKPFFAGTYFQKRQWTNLLTEVQFLFQEKRLSLEDLAMQIKAGVERIDFVGVVKDSALFTKDVLDTIVNNRIDSLDFEWGGDKGNPKFPIPVELDFFIQYLHKNTNPDIEKYLNLTLSRMAMGGIYDHVGGGFSRYSTDPYWKIPHFEKMLYDQGQLIELYAKAYQVTKNDNYRSVAEKTISFVNRELKSEEGAYFSSLDADSAGKEGAYYAWSYVEILTLLGDNANLFIEFYNISIDGNWEAGNNILFQTESREDFAARNHMSLQEVNDIIEECLATLEKERGNRERPPLDDKILTSWNAIMIKGLARAYMAFGKESYLQDAIDTSLLIEKTAFRKDGGLWRSLKGKKGSINAFLDDYALLIDAWIELYQASMQDKWIFLAQELCEYVYAHFFNEDNQLFYYTSVLDEPLLIRKSEISDNVIPSSNSVMAMNLYRLSKYFLNKETYHTSFQMLKNMSGRIDDHGKYYANWQRLKLYFIHQNYELVIAGEDIKDVHRKIIQKYNPFVFVASANDNLPVAKNKSGKNLLFHLCQNNTCHLPLKNLQDVFDKIE